jgi:hypothetical protein
LPPPPSLASNQNLPVTPSIENLNTSDNKPEKSKKMDKKTVVGLAGICLVAVGAYVYFTYGWEHGLPSDIMGRAKDPLALVLGLLVMIVGGVLLVCFLIEPIGRKGKKEEAKRDSPPSALEGTTGF